MGHLRGHPAPPNLGESGVEKAAAIGEAKKNPTIFEARSRRFASMEEIPGEGKDKDGVEWYGEGFEEKRQFQETRSRIPGRFTA